jgi:hypothetical protein
VTALTSGPAAEAGATPPRRLTGHNRDRIAYLVRVMAAAGADDPTIGIRLELTNNQVRGIRRSYKIPAGQPRR